MRPFILFLILGFLGFFAKAHGQCSYPVDTLYFESFEGDLPASWSFKPNKDRWMLDESGFGSFTNPGESNWVYLDDQGNKNSELAQIETSSFDLSAHGAFAELSFWLNFQEFDKHGSFTVEMFSKEEWVKVYETYTDFEGKVIIDIKDLVGTYNKFRFSYSDGGVDGWGVGIDGFLITGSASICGNKICELGEDPETCPGDCPALTDYPDTWIPEGEDLSGNAVSFSNFIGNQSCDDCSQEVDLGFSFQFYENTYTQVFINSNGNVSFAEDFVSYVPKSFCLDGAEIIAPFFSDVDLSKGGRVSYYKDPENHYVLIYWDEVAFFGCDPDCDSRNSYQLILTDGSIEGYKEVILPAGTNVIMSYGDMQWTGGTASGGYLGFGGSAATVGINSGQAALCSDYGVFDNPSYVFQETNELETCLAGGVNHLDYKKLFFDASKGELADYKGIASIKGIYTGKGIALDWEIDFVDLEGLFVVERMLLGEEYQEYVEIAILHIDAEEIEKQTHKFSFLDENLHEGAYRYRLSYLGEATTNSQDSVEVQLFQQREFTDSTQIFSIVSYGPNPLQDQLEVILSPNLSETEVQVMYSILDMAGHKFVNGTLVLTENNSSLKIDTQDLPAGLYVLSLNSQQDKQYIRLAKN